MQKLFRVIRITILLTIPIILSSCASSSYYERYGSKSSSNSSSKKSNSEETDENVSSFEDEILQTPSNVSNKEKELIIDKLSDITNTNKKKEKFLQEIVSYLNTPYRYGGESRKGIDCSAFTQKIYKNSLNVNIPRTAREQYRAWNIFKDKDKLKFGDLIYFNTSKRYFPGHVGIYLDDNLFAHASSSNGVIVSSLNNNYYSMRYVGANRIKINNK